MSNTERLANSELNIEISLFFSVAIWKLGAEITGNKNGVKNQEKNQVDFGLSSCS
jgi:hypothetical protein